MVDGSITEIRYQFWDASVPPDCHRSYSITITAREARVVVDSYGDILAERTYPVTESQFEELRESLEANRISNCTLTDDETCTGGTSERISCSGPEGESFSGTVYHCGGSDTGDLCGDISAFARDVKNLIPGLDELLK